MGFVSHAEYCVEGCNGFLMHYMTFCSPECSGTQVQEPTCAFPGFSQLYTSGGEKGKGNILFLLAKILYI